MNNGLSGIKNIIWALAIVIALLALLVGLIFTVATRSYGDAPDGTLVLSSGSQAIDSRGSGQRRAGLKRTPRYTAAATTAAGSAIAAMPRRSLLFFIMLSRSRFSHRRPRRHPHRRCCFP